MYFFEPPVLRGSAAAGHQRAGVWLVHLAPGGPFDRERAPASPEIERNLKAKYHLNEPIWKQYLRYLGSWRMAISVASLKYRNHTVNDIIAQGLPVSMTAGRACVLFCDGHWPAAGIFHRRPARALGGLHRQFSGHAGRVRAGLCARAVPDFGVCHQAEMAAGGALGIAGAGILPTIALGLYFAGKVARLFREGMLNAMQSEFVTAARAKGLGENRLLLKHAVRIAVLPVVSYSGPMLADLLTGSFIIENIFQIPGIGVFFVNGALNRDYTVVVGLALLYAVLLIALNLAVDFAYTWLDPRVKYE